MEMDSKQDCAAELIINIEGQTPVWKCHQKDFSNGEFHDFRCVGLLGGQMWCGGDVWIDS